MKSPRVTIGCALLALLTSGCLGPSTADTPSASPTFKSLEPTGSAGAADTACIPQTQNQGCRNQQQMWCEDTTQTWQPIGVCPTDMICLELPDATLPGALLAKCDVKPVAPDAVGADGGPVGQDGNSVTPTGICARWLLDRQDMNEGTWTGSAAKCEPGDLSTDAKDNALRLVNLYRYLTHMPPVVRDPVFDSKAQACALMMYANKQLSHTPPPTWKCYTADGAQAAKSSNLSTGSGVVAVDRYMVDSGANNHATLGHRRWILSRSLDKIGVGSSASKGSCLWVIGGKAKAPRKWVAWPPDGKVPLAAFSSGGGHIDNTGWSLQSDTVSFAKAKIIVSSDGKELATTPWLLKGGYGSKYAIAWTPKGWKTEAGRTYHVKVQGSSADFEYDVSVLDCTK